MTQMGMGVAALNHDSKFAAAYERGVKKTEYWTYALEDSLDLIAKLPALAARIYRNSFYPGKEIAPLNKDQDLVGNYVDMLGYGNNEGMKEYLRLYIAIHGDHEGGNASAHTARMYISTFGAAHFTDYVRFQTWSARPCPTLICLMLPHCTRWLVPFTGMFETTSSVLRQVLANA